MNQDVLNDFLSRYPSLGTRKTYKWALSRFLNHVLGESDVTIQMKMSEYLGQERKVKRDLEGFFAHCAEIPPKSQGVIEGTLRSFFNYISDDYPTFSVSPRFWVELRRMNKGLKSKRALTADVVPTNEQLRSILSYCPVHGRALFLTMSSGGMRIGDAVNIKLADLHLHQNIGGLDITLIDILDEKTSNRRTVPVSDHATEAIEDWLKVRKEWLTTASKKSMYEKMIEDDRLFPLDSDTARSLWTHAVKKAGLLSLDTITKRMKIHPHTLRKFYRTKMAGAGVPVDIVEALIGHEAYLDEYRRYTMEELVQFYHKGMSALSVRGPSPDVQSQLDRHQEALRVLANIALGAMTSDELKHRLKDNGVDPEMAGLGGGKAIKTEWDAVKILKELADSLSQGK